MNIKQRLEYLRGELRAERISLDEIHELQHYKPYIDADDVELLEAAGVPEHEDDEDDKLLSYDDLAALIAQMSPDDRAKPVLSQNGTTGAYYGFNSIGKVDGEWDLMPDGHPILDADDNWLWYQNGKVKRSRHEPDWDKIRNSI